MWWIFRFQKCNHAKFNKSFSVSTTLFSIVLSGVTGLNLVRKVNKYTCQFFSRIFLIEEGPFRGADSVGTMVVLREGARIDCLWICWLATAASKDDDRLRRGLSAGFFPSMVFHSHP